MNYVQGIIDYAGMETFVKEPNSAKFFPGANVLFWLMATKESHWLFSNVDSVNIQLAAAF